MTTAEKIAVLKTIQGQLGIVFPVEIVEWDGPTDQIIQSPAMRLRKREQSDTQEWALESSVWKGRTIAS